MLERNGKWSENRLTFQLMTKTFTLLFLFAWASMIVGYLLGILEVPPTMFLINLLFGWKKGRTLADFRVLPVKEKIWNKTHIHSPIKNDRK